MAILSSHAGEAGTWINGKWQPQDPSGLWPAAYDSPQTRQYIASIGAVGISQEGIPIFATTEAREAFIQRAIANGSLNDENSIARWRATPLAPDVPKANANPTADTSLADVVATYKQAIAEGKDAAQARADAIYSLTMVWEQTGLSLTEAFNRAMADFDRTVKSGQAVVATGVKTDEAKPAPIPTAVAQYLTGPLAGKTLGEARRELPFQSQFQSYLNQEVPQGGYGPLRSFLAGQQDPLSNLYSYGQLAGDIPDPTSFRDYLAQRGGIGRPGVEEFRKFAERGAQELGTSPLQQSRAFRGYLRGVSGQNPEGDADLAGRRQFELGVSGAFPELAREARPFFEAEAKNAYQQFRYDRPGEDFLPYLISRGYNFF